MPSSRDIVVKLTMSVQLFRLLQQQFQTIKKELIVLQVVVYSFFLKIEIIIGKEFPLQKKKKYFSTN